MNPNVDRLGCPERAHREAEPRASGETSPAAPHAEDGSAPCPVCGRSGDRTAAGPLDCPLSTGELDALHFRFWSPDHKRFDHIGFAHAVLAACASGGARGAD